MSRPARSRILPAVVTVVVLFLAVGVAQRFSLLPHLGNPMTERTVDRTGPAVLHALSDLSDYHGSTSELQVLVDLEKDTKYVPSFIKGEKAVYEAIGTVDGVVDLAGIEAQVETVDGETVVTVTVPRAELSDVRLDLDRSKLLSRDRGLIDRVGGLFSDEPTSERALQQAGEDKLADAAEESSVRELAEKNTRVMLTDLLRQAGADEVIVRFEEPASSPAA